MKLTKTDRTGIRIVIENQLKAFQNDDATGAFALASQEIRQQLGTAQNFMQMVKRYYKALYRPRAVLFENLTTINGQLTQPVLLLAPHGVPVKALYVMDRENDGGWKINGCYLVPIKEVK